MKKILALALLVAVSGSLAMADDVTLSVAKATDTTAKVTVWPGGKTATVPVKFADGATWDNAKDSYSVSSETATGVENKTVCMTVNSDGGVSFKKNVCSTKKKSSAKAEATKDTTKK